MCPALRSCFILRSEEIGKEENVDGRRGFGCEKEDIGCTEYGDISHVIYKTTTAAATKHTRGED
jgi:hypothetical protein